MGFGPFRWVCTSGDPHDLATTDRLAKETFENIVGAGIPENFKQQYADNLKWIEEAGSHNLVVGSQARILYSNQQGRVALALAFNRAIRDGQLKVGLSDPMANSEIPPLRPSFIILQLH